MMRKKVKQQINSNERIMSKQKLERKVFLDYLQQVNTSSNYSNHYSVHSGTNAKVYIRIHDKNGEVSEPIELHKSVNHKNKFERGQTDGFDVGELL